MLFWLFVAGMIVIALAFVLPPLLGREEAPPANELRETTVAVYRDQLRELENDLHNGIVGRDQYQQDRDELERRMLEEVPAGDDSPKTKQKAKAAQITSRNLAHLLSVVLPVAAILFYLRTGNQNARTTLPSGEDQAVATAPPQSSGDSSGASGGRSRAQIEANVAKLAQKMEQNPNDAAGWAMLARSYSELQNYKEAAAAFEKATALNGNDADLLAEYAFALVQARGQQYEGQPTDLINRALKINPKNQKALILAGNAAFQAKHYDEAIDYWGKVIKLLPRDEQILPALTDRISEARRLSKAGAPK